MIIRQAKAEDIAALADIAVAGYRMGFADIIGYDGLARFGRDFFAARFAQEWPAVAVAEEGITILGFAEVRDGTLEKILRTLAEHLHRRGKLDLTEAFIDGTHAGAKRGALWLRELDAASRPRSWSFQTALVFLSPQGLRVVRDMSRSSSEKPSTRGSRKRSRGS